MHYIAIDHTIADGRNARVLLQADKKNYRPMLRAISGATGIRVAMPKADTKHFPKTFVTIDLHQPLRMTPVVPTWQVERLIGHRKAVTKVEVSPDGASLPSAATDGTILIARTPFGCGLSRTCGCSWSWIPKRRTVLWCSAAMAGH